ncbi:GNAT family N-acetyltransferase [Methylobacterium sp. Leaf88]|uniref:GNAT family N-acetyltransferase n=1 Tax=Methylobacterium sp. Leaf88 TaxID=1736244 RepID=UPI0012E7A792|nr:GNAT family N-acetyltransferase [Methylobacterium sp. Leaf88]
MTSSTMSRVRLLIDTNVLIALEDPGQTEPLVADFARRCLAGAIALYVHPSTLDDFDRDPDRYRRSISESRVSKFLQLAPIPLPPVAELEARWGTIRSENDRVDVALLHALSIKAVDILVSQDAGLHRRVRCGDLEERVITLSDAVAWLKSLQDPADDGLPHVSDVPAYSLDPRDPIFESLRLDYTEFSDWWLARCVAEHRPCWTILGSDGRVHGLVVRKSESGEEIGVASHLRALKLCTFKVADNAQGNKVGELLLRKAILHAQQNSFDFVYLTTYRKQIALLDLIERYGFETTAKSAAGEIVAVKPIRRTRLEISGHSDLADVLRRNYPRFTIRDPVSLFAIPIQWRFHRQLFPEAARLKPMPLFGDQTFDLRQAGRKPGNTIRKVYVCRSFNKTMKAGDVIFFYQSREDSACHSQAVTTVGVVEQIRRAHDYRDLSRSTAGRSVYSEDDLKQAVEDAPNGVTVIDFLLIGHLDPVIKIEKLLEGGVLKAPPQSITPIPRNSLGTLLPSMNFGFAL